MESPLNRLPPPTAPQSMARSISDTRSVSGASGRAANGSQAEVLDWLNSPENSLASVRS